MAAPTYIHRKSLLRIATGHLFIVLGDATWGDPAIPAANFGKILKARQKILLPEVPAPQMDDD